MAIDIYMTFENDTDITPEAYVALRGLKGDTGEKGSDGADGVGITSIEQNLDGTLTITLDDGSAYDTEPLKGEDGQDGVDGQDGEDGKGIESAVLNADYTLTLTFTDGTSYTTPSIRGVQGEQGIQGVPGEKGEDGESIKGDDGNGIASAVLNSDYTLTLTFTDGTSYTTGSIRGEKGEKGDPGDAGQVDTAMSDSSTLPVQNKVIKAYVDNGLSGKADSADVPTKVSDLTNDTGYITGMDILSYGKSTWADFIAAYQAKKVVYCRASSSSNPASGSQTRLAFMAYVNNADNPTEVEFQYYRSVSSHSASQQGDQVFVYKLTSSGSWTVTTREASTKIVASTGLQQSYSNGTLTVSLGASIPSKTSDLTNDSGFISSETDPTVPSWAKASTKPTYTASEISGLLDMFYPVGSFYETTDSNFDPNTAWGGTWVRESEGLVHIGSGNGYTAGATGGATTSATNDHTLTTSEIPAHTHGSKTLNGTFQARRGGTSADTDICGPCTGIASLAQTGSSVSASVSMVTASSAYKRDVITISATHEHTSVGGGGSHNHGSVSTMQPYVVVNRWHRTA